MEQIGLFEPKYTSKLNHDGQAILEYILLIAIVVMLFGTLMKMLSNRDWYERLAAPLTKDFAYTYRYGHPQARGVDDGSQKYIAQHPDNFRIFINPPTKK